jgi:hypothetical protein
VSGCAGVRCVLKAPSRNRLAGFTAGRCRGASSRYAGRGVERLDKRAESESRSRALDIGPCSVARLFQSGQSALRDPCGGGVREQLTVRLDQTSPGLAPFRGSTAGRVGGIRSGLSCRHRPEPEPTFGTLLDLADSPDDLLPIESREVGAWRDVWRDLVRQLPYDFHDIDLSGQESAVRRGRTLDREGSGGS